MQVNYQDGRTRVVTGLNDVQLADELRGVAAETTLVESIEVWREAKVEDSPYTDNREGRRRRAHDRRRKRN